MGALALVLAVENQPALQLAADGAVLAIDDLGLRYPALAGCTSEGSGALLLPLAQGTDDAIRVNQVGYLPDVPKVAVLCALAPRAVTTFDVVDGNGRRVLGPRRATSTGSFGPCVETYRLDFSALRTPGSYRVRAGNLTSPDVKIGAGNTLPAGTVLASGTSVPHHATVRGGR